jgi:hypothetical protein
MMITLARELRLKLAATSITRNGVVRAGGNIQAANLAVAEKSESLRPSVLRY